MADPPEIERGLAWKISPIDVRCFSQRLYLHKGSVQLPYLIAGGYIEHKYDIYKLYNRDFLNPAISNLVSSPWQTHSFLAMEVTILTVHRLNGPWLP